MSKPPIKHKWLSLSVEEAINRLPDGPKIRCVELKDMKPREINLPREKVISLLRRYQLGESGPNAQADGLGIVFQMEYRRVVFIATVKGPTKINLPIEIVVREAVRAGDVILFRFRCPRCNAFEMGAENFNRCGSCGTVFKSVIFTIGQHDNRILCGSFRKSRRSIGKKVIQSLWSIQEGYCAYCDCDLRNIEYEVEHVLPLAAGGTNDPLNLVLSCPPCNRTASSLVFRDYLAKRSYLQSKRRGSHVI